MLYYNIIVFKKKKLEDANSIENLTNYDNIVSGNNYR